MPNAARRNSAALSTTTRDGLGGTMRPGAGTADHGAHEWHAAPAWCVVTLAGFRGEPGAPAAVNGDIGSPGCRMRLTYEALHLRTIGELDCADAKRPGDAG